MTKVFHVLTESEPFSEVSGGAISRWAANVTRCDRDAIVCAPLTDESWGFETSQLRSLTALSRYGVFNDLTKSHIPWPMRRRLLLGAFERLLDEVTAGDTVWVHNRPEYAAALSERIRDRGGRTVLHMHNSHLVQWVRKGHPLPGADMYVFVSRFLESEARDNGADMHRAEVLYNGADHSIFYPTKTLQIRRGTPLVLFAGRLVPEKGVHVFLKAMSALEQAGEAIQGVVIGSGGFGDRKPNEYAKQLQAMAPGNVVFENYCSGTKLGEYFRKADMFCQPSCWHDPFPLAVLEAMACRLPVVTTRSGGIPEALSEGGGLTVERGNVSELQAGLKYLARNADVRGQMGKEGYASFQRNFTWEHVRSKYREIVKRLWSDTEDREGLRGAVNEGNGEFRVGL